MNNGILTAFFILSAVLVLPCLAQDAAKPAGSAKSVESAGGKTFSTLSTDEKRRLYEQNIEQLKRVNQEKDTITRDVDALAFEQARLKSELIDKAQQIKTTEKTLSATEQEILELKAKEHVKRIEFAERSGEMAKIIAVLQRLGRQPPPVMVTERSDALNMVRSGMLLAHSFSTIKPFADALAAELKELETISTDLAARQEKEKQLLAELGRRRLEIEPVLAAQRERIQTGQARLDVLKAAALKHTQAIATLGDVVAKLDIEVGLNTGLGAYEAELRSGAAVELKPQAKKLAFIQPGRMKPSIPFQEAKGLLPKPAEGNLIRAFGAPDGYGGQSKGLMIETREKAQITAPCDGWVVYADNLKSYGQLLIINAGGGYHILLSGMSEIQVGMGQFVLAGEPVAVMGSQSQSGNTGDASKPTLYVEFRKDQKPIDPDPWWSSGIEKG